VIRARRAAGIWNLRYYAFPRPWLKYINRYVPLYNRLPLELRALYQDKVIQFVDAKLFRPCGSMDEVTPAEQIPIAGNACLLALNTGNALNFPAVLTVQVFRHEDPDAEARINCVALSWDATNHQATDPRDRDKAALVPIAAQLGWETAGKSGLPEALLLAPWARVRAEEFAQAFPGVLEKAAAGEPSEVFGVATEMFLGAPALLQQKQPALYDCLRRFYSVDPARWKTNR
jgi:Mlc titration factor MtfA (ptsG expression regulator)